MRRTRPVDIAIDTMSRTMLHGRALLRKAVVRISIPSASDRSLIKLAVFPKLA
jgi:hypothetical protein